MSYITKDKDTMFKEERNQVTLNKELFAFASDFNDIYFANDLNWGKIAIHFKHSTSNQKKIVVLREESNTGWFEASALARTGVWQIEMIQVFDKDGDMTDVKRSGMPSPENFDITTTVKIAPSESIISFQDDSNVVVGAGKTEFYEVGFKVRIWDDVANIEHDAVIYTITNIVGDIITLDTPVANHAGKTLRLRFPSFADSSARQKSIFQYVGITYGA